MFEHQTSIIIHRTPAEVFAFLTYPANMRSWRTEIIQFNDLTPEQFAAGKRWSEQSQALGKVITSDVEVLEVNEGYSYSLKTTSQNVPFISTYQVEVVPEGTRLKFHVEANLPLMLKMVEPMIRNNTVTSIERNFKQLKWVMESGE